MDSPVRAVIPRYLIYFAIPPIVAALVISALDPYAGLAMLANVAVMAIVLRILIDAERPERQSPGRVPPDHPSEDPWSWVSPGG